MPTRPPIGTDVVLERAGLAWMDGAVAGHEGNDILLRIPDGIPIIDRAPVRATLVWTTERGVFRAEATVRSNGRECRVSPMADADRLQRREHVRLQMGTKMTLSHRAGTCRGILVDVSEAALRTRVRARPAAGFQPGDEVRAAFTLHHTGFMLRGSVLREQETDEPGTIDVVVMLDIPARTANDLRRNVVFEQVDRRQADRRQAER